MSRHPDALTVVQRDVRRAVRKPEVEIHFNNGEVRTMDFRADLARVTCPTLVLSGEMDPVCPPSSFHEVVASLPDRVAEPHLVAGAGHLAMLDARDECERIIRDFVLRHSPVRSSAAAGAAHSSGWRTSSPVTAVVTVVKALSSLCDEHAIRRAKPVAVGDDRR
jgi:Serine aminopeptidase, S33